MSDENKSKVYVQPLPGFEGVKSPKSKPTKKFVLLCEHKLLPLDCPICR